MSLQLILHWRAAVTAMRNSALPQRYLSASNFFADCEQSAGGTLAFTLKGSEAHKGQWQASLVLAIAAGRCGSGARN